MKKFTILFLLLCFSICWGQRREVLDSVQRTINQRIDDTKLKATIDHFFSDYTTAKPISRAELWESKVGICIDVLPKKNSLVYYPAKFDTNYATFDTNVFSIEDNNDKEAQEKYIQSFQKGERSKIQKSAYFDHVKFQYLNQKTEQTTIYTNDIFIRNKHYATFLRSKGEYIYGLAVANKYDNDFKNAIFKLYIFDKKLLSENDLIEIEDKRKEAMALSATKTDYSLYHEKRINDLVTLMKKLLDIFPSYRDDPKLVAAYEKLKEEEPLDKGSLWLIRDILPYLSDLKIEETQSGILQYNLKNIAHLAAHSLADIYYGNKEYDKAEKYLLKALYEAPYEDISATTVKKDNERIFLELVGIYQRTIDKTDKVIVYLLPLLVSSYYQKVSNEQLITYIPEGKRARVAFKKEIDKALHSAITTDNGDIEIVFKGEKVRFWYHGIKQFVEEVKDSDFYKRL